MGVHGIARDFYGHRVGWRVEDVKFACRGEVVESVGFSVEAFVQKAVVRELYLKDQKDLSVGPRVMIVDSEIVHTSIRPPLAEPTGGAGAPLEPFNEPPVDALEELDEPAVDPIEEFEEPAVDRF